LRSFREQVANRLQDADEVEEVVLIWDERKRRKGIRDLAMDNLQEDREVLTYYR
jgi:hypothetical protein